MNSIPPLDPTRLVIAAVIGLIILLVLIIRFKLPAMIAILVGAVLIGLGAGMSFDQIVGAVDDGIGNTLKGIALLVGLGSMFGSILEISGGAQTLAVTMVDKFGDRKAAWADYLRLCRAGGTKGYFNARFLRCRPDHPYPTCLFPGQTHR